MNVQPVIARELTAQSRQAGTYWLRVVGAAVTMSVFALAATGPIRSGRELGEYLFDTLNAAAYHLILLCVPLLTADSVSREKREGTLGLLFLTPLRAGDIVVGKALSQALRGSTLLIALLPVLLLPVLLGGVGWIKALATVCVHACAFLIALTAGLVVSSLAERPVRAALGAVLFALVAVMPLNFLLATIFGVELWPPLFLPMDWLPSVTMAAQARGWLFNLSLLLAGAGVAAAGGLWQAARQVSLFWQEAEASTDRLRAVVGMWIRIVGVVTLATQMAVAITAWISGSLATSGEMGAWMNLLWLAPLPLLAAVVCVNRRAGLAVAGRLPAGGRNALAATRSGWRFFWWWAVLAGICPLLGTLVYATNPVPNPLFIATSAATLTAVGLSAGTLAYAWRRRWATGVVWSLVFGAGLTAVALTVFGAAAYWRAERILLDTDAISDAPLSQLLMSPLLGTFIFVTGCPGLLSEVNVFTGIPPGFDPALTRMVWENSLFLAGLAMATAIVLPRVLERRLRLATLTHAAEETLALRRDFCEPLWGRRWFATRQRMRLNANPIGWLHARQWSGRLTGWGWCLAAVVSQVPVFLNLRGLETILAQQAWLFVALQAGVAFAAAGSFQREKLSGVLELILVTPISATQLVKGRWAALIRQFLPTVVVMALLLVISLQLLWTRTARPGAVVDVLASALPMISMPLIGLYLSLRLRSVIAAWLATCGVGLALSGAAIAASVGVMWVLAQAKVPVVFTLYNPGDWSGWHWMALGILVLPSLMLHLAAARYAWVRLVIGLASRRLVLP